MNEAINKVLRSGAGRLTRAFSRIAANEAPGFGQLLRKQHMTKDAWRGYFSGETMWDPRRQAFRSIPSHARGSLGFQRKVGWGVTGVLGLNVTGKVIGSMFGAMRNDR